VAEPNPKRILRLAGALFWLWLIPSRAQHLDSDGPLGPLWFAAWLCFGAGYLWVTRPRPVPSHPPHSLVAVALAQACAALLLVRLSGPGMEAGLLTVLAGTLPAIFPSRIGIAWISVQSAALWYLLATREGAPPELRDYAFGHFTFQLFALGSSHVVCAEAGAREALAAANEDQLASQALLAESSRALERLRISRELHDALGHHLTALVLRLEAAALQPTADHQVSEALVQARAALAEVRASLGELREKGNVDIRPALLTLAAAVTRPSVHLEFAGDLRIPDSRASHAVFRCVQEIVTNSARHAVAQNLWIDCTVNASGVEIRARDDGRGASAVRLGAGLRGMRERLQETGGGLEVRTAPEQGFSLRAWLPVRGQAT